MGLKDQLHQLIEDLPESELYAARRFLQSLQATAACMPRTLIQAPWDDEPETEAERQAVEEARQELARGEGRSLEDVRRELGS